MFQRILIPVDLSERNAAAVDRAAELARLGGSELYMLHVIETIDEPFEDLEEFYEQLERNARERMGKIGARLKDKDIALHQQISYGKRVPEIIKYADDNDIDLIVIGSHRLDPENPAAGWMTISHQVAIAAGCAVLVIK